MEEVEGAPAGGDEPEQHVGKVEPDSLLHAHDAAIAFRVLVDIHAGEDADDGSVKDAIIVTPVLAISLSLTLIYQNCLNRTYKIRTSSPNITVPTLGTANAIADAEPIAPTDTA